MTFLEIVVFLAILLIMLVGLAGVILPVLPGIPLIAGAVLLYGITTGFEKITPGIILIFAGFTGLGRSYYQLFFREENVRRQGRGETQNVPRQYSYLSDCVFLSDLLRSFPDRLL